MLKTVFWLFYFIDFFYIFLGRSHIEALVSNNFTYLCSGLVKKFEKRAHAERVITFEKLVGFVIFVLINFVCRNLTMA